MTQLDEILQGVESVAIGGHVRPDGDCISSCLATYNYIRTYYPKIDAALYLEPIPNIFKFLTRADEIISEDSREKVYDLFIAQDCGDMGRLGDAARYCKSAKRTVCIDHHISNTGFADEDRSGGKLYERADLPFAAEGAYHKGNCGVHLYGHGP